MSFPESITKYIGLEEYLHDSPDEFKHVANQEKIPYSVVFLPENLTGMILTMFAFIFTIVVGPLILGGLGVTIYKGGISKILDNLFILIFGIGAAGVCFYIAYIMFLYIKDYLLYLMNRLKIGYFFEMGYIMIRRTDNVIWILPIDMIGQIYIWKYTVRKGKNSYDYFSFEIESTDARTWSNKQLSNSWTIRGIFEQIEEYCKNNRIQFKTSDSSD